MADYKGVAVYCETSGDELAPIAAEGLGIGRKLADEMGQELAAVMLGSSAASLAQKAISYGADKVYVVEDSMLKDYQADAYVAAMEKVIGQALPQVLIMGQTDIGRDLAPKVAFKLDTSATMDCLELAVDPSTKRLLATKPVYGGNALGIFSGATDPQIVTIRTKAMTPLAPDSSRQGDVITVDAGLDESVLKAKMVEKVVEEVEGIRLDEADVVVAGGRGIGSVEGFQQLEELARLLKGAVGASRPPCDNGWAADTLQIGLTGKIIAPDIYIAIAISGSSQHMSGCSGSKNIIAINKDAEANIFREARFGVVGDWKKVLPAFTGKVRELLAS